MLWEPDCQQEFQLTTNFCLVFFTIFPQLLLPNRYSKLSTLTVGKYNFRIPILRLAIILEFSFSICRRLRSALRSRNLRSFSHWFGCLSLLFSSFSNTSLFSPALSALCYARSCCCHRRHYIEGGWGSIVACGTAIIAESRTSYTVSSYSMTLII